MTTLTRVRTSAHFALLASLIALLAATQAQASTPASRPDKSSYTLFNPTPSGLMRELSTDRPDQTESPNTVDAGHFQVEMDLAIMSFDRDRTNGEDLRTTDLALAPMNLKVGLLNNVDLQFMVDPYVRSKLEDRNTSTTYKASGFGDITTRVKVNLWGNDNETKTAFALMPFVKWPLSSSEVRNGKTEGGLIAMLGYELPAGWSSCAMTEVDFVANDSGGRDTLFFNTITFAHDLTEKLGGYVELAVLSGDSPDIKVQVQFDAGLTYALDENTQLDCGCNFGLSRAAPDYQPFIGLSRRF
ncbi:transporter [Nibricoccus sp. IMCC34717]|uniref:transporter n=1 Tax=Nibricoccus sp. IMCC34717 TaxID=3034021 RepID=UPI00384B7F6C